MDFGAGTLGSEALLCHFLFILNRMLLFYINFGDRNPPYPALGSNIPSARRPRQRFNFLQLRGSSPSLRFVNRHGGTLRRAGWVAFIIVPASPCVPVFEVPASPSHTSLRPKLDVSRPQVPSPHTRVPMSPSPCTRPTEPIGTLRSEDGGCLRRRGEVWMRVYLLSVAVPRKFPP